MVKSLEKLIAALALTGALSTGIYAKQQTPQQELKIETRINPNSSIHETETVIVSPGQNGAPDFLNRPYGNLGFEKNLDGGCSVYFGTYREL